MQRPGTSYVSNEQKMKKSKDFKELLLIRDMSCFDFLNPGLIHFLLLQKLARLPLEYVSTLQLWFPVNTIIF